MLPSNIIPLRILDASYDQAIPPDMLAQALDGDYRLYIQRLSRAAEHRFYQHLLNHLQRMGAWRLNRHLYRWHRLRVYSDLVYNCRQKACEAFDLSR